MNLNLLVIDDDAPTLELMSEVLSSAGTTVSVIQNSEQAASRIHREQFAGIFLDLQMPGIDGFELARRIRQSTLNRSTPITVITGCTDRDTMRNAFSAGGTFYLEKPVDRQKLLKLFRTIRGVLSRRENPVIDGVTISERNVRQ